MKRKRDEATALDEATTLRSHTELGDMPMTNQRHGARVQPRAIPAEHQAIRHLADDEFLAAFEACTLDEFHHRDHIKIACLYLRRHTLDDAITKVRTGLQPLAAAWGAPVDDLERGYHETMTQAWVRIVHLALTDRGVAESADAFCDQHPELMEKIHLQLFYSRERLFTWEAKREFVEPDLSPFA